mgnify:CR=1 FL=1
MPTFINRLAELTVKHLRGELSEEEDNELKEGINKSEEDRLLFQRMTNEDWLKSSLGEMAGIDIETPWQTILSSGVIVPRKIHWWQNPAFYKAAAMFILISGIAIFMYTLNPFKSNTTAKTENPDPDKIAPDPHRRGQLITAGNKPISLGSAADGVVAVLPGAQVELQGKHLTVKKTQPTVDTAYNTLIAERGGNYQITLTDGTTVWLNAESSIRFPTSFAANERKVEISGEVYFEVSKDQSRPFKVKVRDLTVEVLGTYFNIEAHDKMPSIKTTLLEGSVKVIQGDKNKILQPGQVLVVTADGKFTVKQTNLIKVTAWKGELFDFRNDSLTTILSELGRWYNMEIVYKSDVSKVLRSGSFSRNRQVQDVLNKLSIPAGFDIKRDTIIIK